MLVGTQIRAARALLRWSLSDLASRSGLNYAIIQRCESAEGIPSTNARNLAQIQRTLELAGIEFLNGDSPGVRLRK